MNVSNRLSGWPLGPLPGPRHQAEQVADEPGPQFQPLLQTNARQQQVEAMYNATLQRFRHLQQITQLGDPGHTAELKRLSTVLGYMRM
jgi:hypothetical protein